MPETFLILVAGGVLLGAGICGPERVSPGWLRAVGGLAVSLCVLTVLLRLERDAAAPVPEFYRRIQWALIVATALAAIGRLLAGAAPWGRLQRALAVLTFGCAVLAGSNLLHELMIANGQAVRLAPKALAVALQTLACGGVASVAGLALTRILPPAGQSGRAAAVEMAPAFRRLGRAWAAALVVRALLAIPVVLWFQSRRPFPELWDVYGWLIASRWLVGLCAPAALVYLSYRRGGGRAASPAAVSISATVLSLAGEGAALYLVRATGLPF